MRVFYVLVLVFVIVANVSCFTSPYSGDVTCKDASIQKFNGTYYLLVSQSNYIEISKSKDLERWSNPVGISVLEEGTFNFNWNVDLHISEEGEFIIYIKNLLEIDVAYTDSSFLGPYNRSSLVLLPGVYHPSVINDVDGRLFLYYQIKREPVIKGRYLNEDGRSFASEEEEKINFPDLNINTNTINKFKIFRKDCIFYCIFGGKVGKHFSIARSTAMLGPYTNAINLETEIDDPWIFDVFENQFGQMTILYSENTDKERRIGILTRTLEWGPDGWPKFSNTSVADLPSEDDIQKQQRLQQQEIKDQLAMIRYEVEKMKDYADRNHILALTALMFALLLLILSVSFVLFQRRKKLKRVDSSEPPVSFANHYSEPSNSPGPSRISKEPNWNEISLAS